MADRADDLEAVVAGSVNLRRQALRVTIVLDREGDLARVCLVQESFVKDLVLGVVRILKLLDETLVELRLHGVADGVVAPDTVLVGARDIADQEVLGDEGVVLVVLLPVVDSSSSDILKDDSPRGTVHIGAEVLNNAAFSACRRCLASMVPSNGDVNDDSLCEGRVEVALGGLRPHVVLKAVAAIEELADVATNVVLKNESSTRVLVDEFLNIEDKIVQDNELTTVLNGSLELVGGHLVLQVGHHHVLAELALVPDLSSSEADDEESDTGAAQSVRKRVLAIVGVEVVPARCDDELRAKNEETAEPLVDLSHEQDFLTVPGHADLQSDNVRGHTSQDKNKSHNEEGESKFSVKRAVAVDGPAACLDGDEASGEDHGA